MSHTACRFFQQQAKAIIHRLNAQGRVPILAGGTGLYIKALLEDYQFNETGSTRPSASR